MPGSPPLIRPDLDPLLDAGRKLAWAQLTCFGGDRVAVLFEELRKRVGQIEGLIEELYFNEQIRAWSPSYRVGDRALFTAQISPGALHATIPLSGPLIKKLFVTRKLSGRARKWFETAVSGDSKHLPVRLRSIADVSSFASLAIKLSKEAS